MKNSKNQLILSQIDKKLETLKPLSSVVIPYKGWIHTFRTAIGMSLRQLGAKMKVSAQNIRQLEEREVTGTITLNSLKQVAESLDMKLVYGFVSKHNSLEKMIENRAYEIAEEIVSRTHQSMILEDQQVNYEHLKKAIENKKQEIINEMPKYLWD